MRAIWTIVFAIVMFETGCSKDGQGLNEWRASLNNGDKPGIGLIVWEKAGQVVDGRFCLLDANFPQDFRHAGVVVPMENLKRLDAGYAFSVSLVESGTVRKETRLLVIDGAFSSSVVKARLRGASDSESLDLEFHLAR